MNITIELSEQHAKLLKDVVANAASELAVHIDRRRITGLLPGQYQQERQLMLDVLDLLTSWNTLCLRLRTYRPG